MPECIECGDYVAGENCRCGSCIVCDSRKSKGYSDDEEGEEL